MSYDKTKLKIMCEAKKNEKIGVKKEIDKLGRICIPKEMRKLFGFDGEAELQVTSEGILLKNPEYILVKNANAKKAKHDKSKIKDTHEKPQVSLLFYQIV